MSPRQGKVRLRRFAAAAACALLAAVAAWPTVAAAETASPSVAAQIAHAEFLPYMDPPPGEPATVCLVDTGVDLNPDTQSNVVSRVALDGGDGGDVWDRKHGTAMAMMMGAPINGWGTVGAWPLVRVASVRAMASGASGFPFSYYARSMLACLNLPSVRVINLSFSGPRPSSGDLAEFDDIAAHARRLGVSVIAGAGNDGGSVQYPAAAPEVLAVAAADGNRGRCEFSAGGPEVAFAAPGCGLELADSSTGSAVSYSGTSAAAAFTSGVVAALRSYRPDAGPGRVEEILRQSATNGVVDVAAAFRTAGLSEQVETAHSRAEAASTQSAVPGSAEDDHPTPAEFDPAPRPWPNVEGDSPARRWPRPRLLGRQCMRRTLLVSLRNRVQGSEVVVRAYRRRSEFGWHLAKRWTVESSRVHAERRFDRVTLQYTGAGHASSPVLPVPRCRGPR